MKHIATKKLCPKCMSEVKYHYTFDAFYCKECDKWLESTCPDTDCEYCKERPEKPSDVEDIK